MDKENVKSVVIEVVGKKVEQLQTVSWCETRPKTSVVSMKSRLSDELGLDSLDRVELAMDLEKVFHMDEMENKQIEKWECVQDVYESVGHSLHLQV